MTTIRLYLMTRQTIIQLTREIAFARVPCVGEWFRFERSGLFPHQVTEVTHDERGNVDIVIGAQHDKRGHASFHKTAADLKSDVDDLIKGGWTVASERPNNYWGRPPNKRMQLTRSAKAKRRGPRS